MSTLESQIRHCMIADQAGFSRRLRALGRRSREPAARRAGLERLGIDIERSRGRRTAREAGRPRPEIPDSLPIAAAGADIAAALAANPVVIVCGETGSGKTTQLPKICLALGRGAAGLIGHTQPRRVAARSVAARIASELGTTLGAAVGYKVRFNERVGEDCYVKVMTDGILLAEVQRDRDLGAYDTLIIDEAHERSLNIDFLLGYLKHLLRRRRDLKVVVSSATIDTARFSAFFDDAPVIEVRGRTHPVEVRYRPPAGAPDGEADPEQAIVSAVEELCAEGPGDILVFLTGEREIRNLSQRLRRGRRDGAEVVPVYARLPLAQQQRLFEAHSRRRLVLATNIAETSLTVPGIRYVVDPGFARIGRYSYHSSVQRLPIERISQASADQRKGRCGRVAPGVCVRLYDEADYLSRGQFNEPEIRRTNLASVLLQMRTLGIRDLADFPFIDPPDRRRVNDGHRLLNELGAIDDKDRLTRLGRRLARLPVDPRIGRMILAADELDCVAEVLVIASALSVQDPRERPPQAETAAAAAHQRYRDERSDFASYLKLWDYVHEQTRGMGTGRLHEFCRKRYLSLARLREWQEVHRQLKEIARDLGLRPHRHGATYARVHRALLTGLLRYVGNRGDERSYVGVRDTAFYVSPLSGQADCDAKWIVAGELVETSRLYAHHVARIRPEWIERTAPKLIRRKYFDAHWDARRGEVMVFEQTSLYGLTVTPRRRVPFAPVHREEAHSLFIRAALVEQRLESNAKFLRRNRQLVEDLRHLEHKLRRPDLLVGDEEIYRFYADLLPQHVCDAAAFDAWRRRAEREWPERMVMDGEALSRRLPEDFADDYPDRLAVGGHDLALDYRFEPGGNADGVTLEVPLILLARLEPESFEWLVPGLLADKVIALLRLLPKTTRKGLSPLADTGRAFLEHGGRGGGSLVNALRDFLRRSFQVEVPEDAWRWSRRRQKLAPHLLMNFRILDEQGARLAEDRDLAALQRDLVSHGGRPGPRLAASRHERDGLRRWDVGTLHDLVEETEDGRLVRGVPALEDRGDRVALTLLPSPEAAAEIHGAGVRRLIGIGAAKTLRRLERELPDIARMSLAYAVLPEAPATMNGLRARYDSGRGLAGELAERALARTVPDAAAVRDAEAFEKALARAKGELWGHAEILCREVSAMLDDYRALLGLLEEDDHTAPQASLADVRTQLRHLVYRGFVGATPDEAFAAYPRYLHGLRVRLTKLRLGGARDADKVEDLAPLWQRYLERAASHAQRARIDPELARYRWMLEEYRISLFAQEIGTAFRISRKRLEEQWQRVGI